MERNDELSIKQFLNMLYESTDNGQRFCFILGAGASVESGIPSGLELSRRWLQELKGKYSKEEISDTMKLLGIDALNLDGEVQSENYFDIYDLRFYPEYKNGYAALEKVMENVEPSYGYYPLAMHLANTNNNLVVTTNFDSLVEDALFICTRKKPFVVVHESLAKLLTLDIQRPIIAKIHRGLFFEPLNRREQLSQMDAAWIKSLGDEFKVYTPIVIGYGGGDNTLMNLLQAENLGINSIYWCYVGKKPNGKIKGIVDKYQGYFIKIGGFDEFMYLLNEKFGYESPVDFMDKTGDRRKESFQNRERELYDRLKKSGKSAIEQEAIVNKIETEWNDRIKALTEVINRCPNDAKAYFKRGNIKYNLRKYEEAIEDYNKAVELDPENTYAYTNCGVVKGKIGQEKEAIEDFDKAIELDPENAAAYQGRGVVKGKIGQGKEAIEDFDKAIELAPKNEGAYYNRGVVKGEIGQEEEAIEDFDKAIELDPENAAAYHSRGVAKGNAGRAEEAMEDFNRAIELNPENAAAYIGRGASKGNTGRVEEAMEDFNKAIELDPENAHAYYNRGASKDEIGRAEEAIEDFNKAIELDSEYIEAYEGRAKAHEAIGQTDNAERDLKKADALRNKK